MHHFKRSWKILIPTVFPAASFPPFSVLACRFQFFLEKVLPQYRDAAMSHTLIYIPSYFDYIRLRNYMKKEEMNFASICEYSSKSEVSRARHFFQKGDKHFVLFTERFHFYKRSVAIVKEIKTIIFITYLKVNTCPSLSPVICKVSFFHTVQMS